MKKDAPLYIMSIGIVTLAYVLTQWYVTLNPAYDLGTFLIGAIVPLGLSVVFPVLARMRILLYALLAYFWALVEDGPVFLDSILTWPEVTRFHPAEPHLLLEAIYHGLTAVFLILAVREAVKGKNVGLPKMLKVALLTLAAFGLAYAQNVPIPQIQVWVESQWYELDVIEHTLSAFLFVLALGEANR